jgi:sugar-specific transcriptional regulator TrmB
MLNPEESVEILTELGLTHTEAKVYITLLFLNTTTARNIHRTSNVARQDVYQILSDLEEKGLIEKVIAKPAKFRPTPANDAVSILLQRRKEENRQLRKRAIQHLRKLEADRVKITPLDKNVQFLLLSKSQTSPSGPIDKPGKAVDKAKESVMGLITLQLFMKVKLMDENLWKKAVKRGVKIKFMIAKRPKEKSEFNLDPLLKNTDYFEIRYTPTIPPATVLLVDEKEAFCRVGVNLENPVLWSSAPYFVRMIKDYLETKWKSLEHGRKQRENNAVITVPEPAKTLAEY